MQIKKIHILIEQGLQQVGVFAYSDFTFEEVDLEINKQMYLFVKEIFNPLSTARPNPSNYYQYNQEVLDRIKNLHTQVSLSKINETEDTVSFELPANYLHYIRSASIVFPLNLTCSMLYCTNIVEGKTYKILSGSILYKGVQYNTGDIFIGEDDKTYEEIPSPIPVNVAELKSKRFRNRLIESYSVDEVMENTLSTTKINSPVIEIINNVLVVKVNNFSVNIVELLYCKKPQEVNFSLGIGLDFPDDVCYDIINKVITALSIASEQNQQKIVNQIQN